MNLLGSMALVAAVAAAGAESAAAQTGVALRVDGTNAVVTVAAGVADDACGLWLACGASDYGDKPSAWPVLQKGVDALAATGGTYVVAIPSRSTYVTMCLRAFALGGASPTTVLRTDRKAYIDLNESPALDRRYEMRFRYDDWLDDAPLCLFGGVSRTGTTEAFQMYGATLSGTSAFKWYFYASTGTGGVVDCGTPVRGVTYDLRLDIRALEQKVWLKRAVDADYTLVGTTALQTIPYAGDLYLFARNDSGADFGNTVEDVSLAAISYYRVTELSTDTLLKNLVPNRDEAGVAGMIDTVSGTVYANAGSGSFTCEAGYASIAASSVAWYSGLRLETPSPRSLKATVDPDISDGSAALCVCWGGEDMGETIRSWAHCTTVCDAVPEQGVVQKLSCANLGIQTGEVVRTVLAPVETLHHVEDCRSNGGCLDLGTLSTDARQYDIRCKFPQTNGALFGGLTADKQAIFQVYGVDGVVCVWFGDATRLQLFTPEDTSTYYDLRLVMRPGSQQAYVKKASETEYVLKASGSVAAIPSGIRLALLGRFVGDTLATTGIVVYFNHYTETDLATGAVVRELVPVRYGDDCQQKAVYDLALDDWFTDVSGDLAMNTVYLGETKAYGTVIGVSPAVRMPLVVPGLVFWAQ